jgi:hypothetical protein
MAGITLQGLCKTGTPQHDRKRAVWSGQSRQSGTKETSKTREGMKETLQKINNSQKYQTERFSVITIHSAQKKNGTNRSSGFWKGIIPDGLRELETGSIQKDFWGNRLIGSIFYI